MAPTVAPPLSQATLMKRSVEDVVEGFALFNRATFPPTELTDEDKTLRELDLLGGARSYFASGSGSASGSADPSSSTEAGPPRRRPRRRSTSPARVK